MCIDKCFAAVKLQPPVAKLATSFCKQYIHYTPTVTKPCSPVKRTQTITIAATAGTKPADVTMTIPPTIPDDRTTVISTCSTVTSFITGSFTMSVNYQSLTAEAGGITNKRALPLAIPAALGANCGSGKPLTAKISSACSCFLGPTKTVTPSVKKSTVKTTVTVTATTTGVASVYSCCGHNRYTADRDLDFLRHGDNSCYCRPSNDLFCGISIATYTSGGKVTCTAPSAAGATNAKFRIENANGGPTIYEGCTESQGGDITTPSGGTHFCDGTNNGANGSPGATLTTQIDAAGDENGFDFDGTYSSSFQDFFITSIAGLSQSSTQFWGLLRNLQITSSGGCQECAQIDSGDEGLWLYDAFRRNLRGLKLSSDYAVVRPGDTVSVTITSVDINGGTDSPAAGISFAGATSDLNGMVTFTAPTDQGCYQYKADGATNFVKSAACYLSVVSGFA